MFRRFTIMTTLLLAVFTNVVLVAAVPLHADSSSFQYTPTNLAIPAVSVSTLLAPVTTPTVPGNPGNNNPKPQDIVSVQPSTSTVTVQPSNGNGTFGAPISTVISGGAQAIAVADFNNDGMLDLVVTQQLADHQDGDIVVLTGDGHGHFSNPVMYAAGRHAGFYSTYSTVQAADLNHDGHPDIVLGESGTECCNRVGIEVLLNNGAGAFSAPIQYSLGSTYVGVLQLTLADMNNDGNLDAVTTNSDSFGGYAIVVQTGLGDGKFAPPVITNAPWPRSFALADFNHDGIMDMVTSTDYYNDNIPRQLAVYMGKGDGNFQPPVLYDVPLNAGEFKVAIVDGNNDGYPDVAVASPNDTRLMFFQNNGTGSLSQFFPAVSVSAHTAVTALLSGDLNGDGTADLLSVNAGGDPGDGTSAPADMTLFFGASLTPPATALSATFGSPLNGTIATFEGIQPQPGLTATIDWGDYTQTVGIVGTPTAGTVIVVGSHTYWVTDSANIRVDLIDASGTKFQSQTVKVNIQSRYVALGDSFSSGEGATGTWPPGDNSPAYANLQGSPPNTDDPNNNMCHRSVGSYAMDFWATTVAASNPNISMVDAACSGAIIHDFYTRYDKNPHGGFYPQTGQSTPDKLHNGEGPQLDRITKDTSLVTLTIGGNDLGFVDILKMCVTGSTTDCLASDSSAIQAAHAIKDNAELVKIYRAIKYRAPGARIMVLGYPRFFPSNALSLNCSGKTSPVHLNGQEMDWLNNRIAVANRLIEAAVKESGVAEYVDEYNAFHDHEICSSGDTGNWDMNGLIVSPVPGSIGSSQESFHPNNNGHFVEAGILASQFNDGQPIPVAQVTQTIAPGAVADIPIDLSAVKSADSFTVSASWPTDASPSIRLFDQNNNPVSTQTYPQSASGSGSTYAYTFVYGAKWQPTTWHLHIDNSGSLAVPLSVNLDAIHLRLPPLANYSPGTGKCTSAGHAVLLHYSLNGSASTADNSLRYPNVNKITNWTWSTGQSGKQSKISGTARRPVDILLRVIDSLGQYGYYATYLTCR